MSLDHQIAVLLGPLACWIILNGLDDLVIDIAALAAFIRRRFSRNPEDRTPSEDDLSRVPERRIAIFVALWKEHRVVRRMIESNAVKLRYSNFDFFIGAYPNDAPTLAAVHETMKSFPNVHQAICPHDGPTSKADCLNWIYQRMLLFEEVQGVRFDIVVIHDAEDIIDPDALRWINYYAQWNDMVQIPVLALPTPANELPHGIYCDEFVEFQFKDMQARQLLGGFIPSTGVGAGFSRRALEKLAESNRNRIFEPHSLTEDYEIGFRVRALGLRQRFVPIHFRNGRPVATREYFPRTFPAAIRQRCRWVMGIALQSWEFHSASETLQYLYWFWRDRKGLIANLISPIANVLFVYGGTTWIAAELSHSAWGLGREAGIGVELSVVGFALQTLHTSIRTWCSVQVYGWRFAALVPVRVLAANWLNCFATLRAIRTYFGAKASGQPLRWAKTSHLYPSRAALAHHHGAAFSRREISRNVTRLLPAAASRRWRVLPFRIFCGELHLVAVEIPAEETQQEIRRFSSLDLRFHLVTPRDFAELASRYLPAM